MLQYDSIDISEAIDIKKNQVNQKIAKFVIIGTLKIFVFSLRDILLTMTLPRLLIYKNCLDLHSFDKFF